ncbi:MAG: hypothetical protein ACI9DM_002242 [Cyclobacteriaceae bacterium]|jgi:hypothetical protein
MKYYCLLVIPFSILMSSCASNKGSTSLQLENQLETFKLGRNDTGVVGRVDSLETVAAGLLIHFSVNKSKQGGTGSPIVSKDQAVELVCSKIFLRVYQERAGKSVEERLRENEISFLVISSSMKSKSYMVTDIINLEK